MPVLLSADIREGYLRLRVSFALTHLSLFLMDYDHKTQQLTAQTTKHSKLVTIQALVLIMGVIQSPAYLSLCLQNFKKRHPRPTSAVFPPISMLP